jgi:tRNA G26 N,N-dimethylase Trm1
VRDAFAAAGIRSPRAAMEVRLVPSAAGAAEDSRKESVA